MSNFKVGDKVVIKKGYAYLKEGVVYTVQSAQDNFVQLDISPDDGWGEWRFELAGVQEKSEIQTIKTGGSTPNQYRLSVNLPLTSDRTQFVDVDFEAMDVIDALNLSGNLKDVQKALFRMGKKQNTPVAYDLNKCLFYILREMKKRGTISHAKFWEVSEMLEKILQAEDVK